MKERSNVPSALCAETLGPRTVESATSRRRRQRLRPVVCSHHLPVPVRQLRRAVPARVPDGPGGCRRGRQRRAARQPRPKQRAQSRVLAQVHHAARLRHRGGQDVLLERSQPVSILRVFCSG